MVWSTRVVRNSIFDDAQTFFFFFFHQKKNKKLSFKRPPPVLKRTSLTSSRVFVCVYVIERERGRGKERKILLRRQNEETAARKRKKKWIKNQSLPPRRDKNRTRKNRRAREREENVGKTDDGMADERAVRRSTGKGTTFEEGEDREFLLFFFSLSRQYNNATF